MSDSPTAPSGFGNVTRFVCSGLAARGHQISILGWQARGAPSSWQGIPVYPVRNDHLGGDVLLTYLQKLRPDVLVTLADVWWLTYLANPLIANFMRMAGIPWALYYPIDGDMGKERLPASWARILETVNLPIAMSQYGRDITISNGVTPAYIPHGVDTQVFRPPADKDAAKRALGYEARFVILSDARNQPRKMLPRTLEIFKRFSRNKPDVLLHLHCDPDDPASRSPEYYYDLRADIAFLEIGDQVRLTQGMSIDSGLTLDRLAAIYQAADVHLLSSWGEGFGLPTLQAAAAGVVPMASDYTASRELVLGHGEALPVRHYLLDQFGIRRALIDIPAAVARLDALYADRALLKTKSEASSRFAQGYDWQPVINQWNTLLLNEVPRLRARLLAPPPAERVVLHSPFGAGYAGSESNPSILMRTVQSAMPEFADGVSVTLNVIAGEAGKLTGEVFRDAIASGNVLSLPAALPSADLALAKTRSVGSIYLGGEQDIRVVQKLAEIFPAIKAWSSAALDLGIGRVSGKLVLTQACPPHDPTYRARMAATTLILDLGGTDGRLPWLAAELGVPCIGPARLAVQKALWPDLSLNSLDPTAAVELGRRMFTDQGAAADACAWALDHCRNRQPA